MKFFWLKLFQIIPNHWAKKIQPLHNNAPELFEFMFGFRKNQRQGAMPLPNLSIWAQKYARK